MFRTFKYIDVEKLYDYLSVISDEVLSSELKSSKTKALSAKLNLGFIEASAKTGTDIESQRLRNIASDYDTFEKALERLSGDEYFDFMTSNDWDVETLPPMSVFRIAASVVIPEAFDMLAMVSQFAPIMQSMGMLESNENPESAEIAFKLISEADADIPILFTENNYKFASKLNSKYIVGRDYQDIEDLYEEEAVLLCKVISYSRKERVEIFDPLKDFVRLNRAMRRNIERNDSLNIILEDGPVMKVEIIAIYH